MTRLLSLSFTCVAKCILLCLTCLGPLLAIAQSPQSSLAVAPDVTGLEVEPVRYDLWQPGTMPNSRGLALEDSIARHRIWVTAQPRLYAFRPCLDDRTTTSVILIPGGGYTKQAYEAAGIAMAKWLNTLGITAFVLLHRQPNSPDVIDPTLAPLQDAQRAVRWVRSHAAEMGLDAHRIGVMGCSAGGHVCACVSSLRRDVSAVGDALDRVSFRPDFCILISPVISMADSIANRGSRDCLLADRCHDEALQQQWSMDRQVTGDNPPTLLIHASDDASVPVKNSTSMYEALIRAGVAKSSLHVFPFGGHAISLYRQPGSTAMWPGITQAWLRETGFLE